MWISSALKSWNVKRHRPHRQKPGRARMAVEALERRCVPAFLAPLVHGHTGFGINVGDFNDDGLADVLRREAAMNGAWVVPGTDVSVFPGNGDGTFADPVTSPGIFPAGSFFGDFEPGDFNNDGFVDLATSSDEGVTIHLGDGTGQLMPGSTFALPAVKGDSQRAEQLALGDMNGDANLDVVVVGFSTGKRRYVNVLLGAGDGTLQHQNVRKVADESVLLIFSKLALGDFNNDTRLDVLVGVSEDASSANHFVLRLLTGRTSGLSSPNTVATLPGLLETLSVADFNSDGDLDFLSQNRHGFPEEHTARLHLGNGHGSFQIVGEGTTPAGIAVDLNLDGKADVVAGDAVAGTISAYLSNGDSTFQAAQTFAGLQDTFLLLAAADFNNDAFTDIVAAGGSAFAVLLNDGDWGDVSPPLSISIGDVQIAEGNSGTTQAVLTVTLSEASSETVTLDYSTADGTALAGSDYEAASGTLTFAPGETSKTITVNVLSDTVVEPNETFVVNLSNATGATIADGQGVVTITNDDVSLPSLTISDVTKKEGNRRTTSFGFTVTLSEPASVPVTVNFATADGTATAASGDYVAKSGSLTFNPGETAKTITVKVNGDRKQEPDETFFVNLTAATGATIADSQGVGTIANDDGLSKASKRSLWGHASSRTDSVSGSAIPQVTIRDASGEEGTTLTFIVSLSEPSNKPVTVQFATADGTAAAGQDYKAKSGTLIFKPGETAKTIKIRTKEDRTFEFADYFYVDLLFADGAEILDGRALGEILNDDPFSGGLPGGAF